MQCSSGLRGWHAKRCVGAVNNLSRQLRRHAGLSQSGLDARGVHTAAAVAAAGPRQPAGYVRSAEARQEPQAQQCRGAGQRCNSSPVCDSMLMGHCATALHPASLACACASASCCCSSAALALSCCTSPDFRWQSSSAPSSSRRSSLSWSKLACRAASSAPALSSWACRAEQDCHSISETLAGRGK